LEKLISVALATYNGEKYIIEQLESILNQTYINIEICISDDNSQDKTVDIIKSFQHQHKNIKLNRNSINLGFVKNFEKAIEMCNGDYIALSDQDDIWLEKKLELLRENIENNDLIFSSAKLIYEDGIEPNKEFLFTKENIDFFLSNLPLFLYVSNFISGCTMMFRSEIVKDILPIPKNQLLHDWWIAIVANERNGIQFLDMPLIKYRQHNNNVISGIEYNRKYGTGNILHKLIGKRKSERNLFYRRQIERLNDVKLYIDSNNLDSKEIDKLLNYYKLCVFSFFHIKCFFYARKHIQSLYNRKYKLSDAIRDCFGVW